MSRFIVGVDLGTTNSALAFVDTEGLNQDGWAPIESFAISQLVAPGEVADRPTLPSFLYVSTPDEQAATSVGLPWSTGPGQVVGTLARDLGAKVPGRVVSSAKSWLSHTSVDPRSAILPPHAPEEVTRVSPVDASRAYLEHLRFAWNEKHPKAPLEEQEIYLTVPASFDAAARELTIEAASRAGLPRVTLLEEPQAAFYAWLAREGEGWRRQVRVGDLILVCDVGGGTTDFSLIGVQDQAGDLSLTRVAVGDHILLGGDNMDLALAHAVGETMPNGMAGLDRIQQTGLAHACRVAKETLFASASKSSAPVVVLGRGSKVIGGSLKSELTRTTLEQVILDGFFPKCKSTDEPMRSRRMGLTELGLPYASDAGITRHLARFLNRQAGSLHADKGLLAPSAVLFNGGVFKAKALQNRVLDVLESWSGVSAPTLENVEYDLAVSRGAAYYGLARRGKGVRIRGGVAMSYYIGIETSAPAVPGVPPPVKALCVVPHGMEEGTEANVPSPEIGLVVGEPAQFRFFGSTVRRDDQFGTVLERWSSEEVQELAPIEAELPVDELSHEGDVVPVRLQSHLTEVGTLDLWCQSTDGQRRWKLQYHVRPGEGD